MSCENELIDNDVSYEDIFEQNIDKQIIVMKIMTDRMRIRDAFMKAGHCSGRPEDPGSSCGPGDEM